MTVDLDYDVNIAELMTNIDVDRAEPIKDLPIVGVTDSDVIYYE